jgi:hypothetical protein
MWENVPNCTLLVICLFRVSYFAISLSQIDNQLLFNYFAKYHSQIKE